MTLPPSGEDIKIGAKNQGTFSVISEVDVFIIGIYSYIGIYAYVNRKECKFQKRKTKVEILQVGSCSYSLVPNNLRKKKEQHSRSCFKVASLQWQPLLFEGGMTPLLISDQAKSW